MFTSHRIVIFTCYRQRIYCSGQTDDIIRICSIQLVDFTGDAGYPVGQRGIDRNGTYQTGTYIPGSQIGISLAGASVADQVHIIFSVVKYSGAIFVVSSGSQRIVEVGHDKIHIGCPTENFIQLCCQIAVTR